MKFLTAKAFRSSGPSDDSTCSVFRAVEVSGWTRIQETLGKLEENSNFNLSRSHSADPLRSSGKTKIQCQGHPQQCISGGPRYFAAMKSRPNCRISTMNGLSLQGLLRAPFRQRRRVCHLGWQLKNVPYEYVKRMEDLGNERISEIAPESFGDCPWRSENDAACKSKHYCGLPRFSNSSVAWILYSISKISSKLTHILSGR